MTARLRRVLTASECTDHEIAEAFATASRSAGAVVHRSDGQVLTVGGCYPRRPSAEDVVRLAVGQGVVGSVARNGFGLRLASDRPRSAGHAELLGVAESDSLARMCLPARAIGGRIQAVVALHRPTHRPYRDADLTEFQPYADMLGLRLQALDLADAVDAHREDRERLIAQAISAQEAERRRIAYDLHDGVTTALASMSFHLNAAEIGLGEGQAQSAQDQIAAARALVDLAYDQTRAAITGLHSLVLSDLGLVAALESMVRQISPTGVQVRADPPERFASVPEHAAAALYRIAQEAVSNAIRHAEAENVVVSIRRTQDAIVLGISDDGVGFEVRSDPDGDFVGSPPGHYGLSSIAERCALVQASLRVESLTGEGTTVIVELPLSA